MGIDPDVQPDMHAGALLSSGSKADQQDKKEIPAHLLCCCLQGLECLYGWSSGRLDGYMHQPEPRFVNATEELLQGQKRRSTTQHNSRPT
jgi:hypothetical protein